MPTKKGNSLDSIAEHVTILNEELGMVQKDISIVQKDITKLKTSMKWTVRIIGYMALLLTAIASKTVFF